MRNKPNPTRDAFTFSLGGLRAVSTVAHAPAIAGDRINQSIAERLAGSTGDQPPTPERAKRVNGRLRLCSLRRPV